MTRLLSEPVSAGHEGIFAAEVDAQGVVHVHGEVDQATAPELEAAIEKAMTAGTGDLVIDLSDVSFLDSGGMNVFVRCAKPLGHAGRQLILREPQPAVRRALEIGGIGTFATVS